MYNLFLLLYICIEEKNTSSMSFKANFASVKFCSICDYWAAQKFQKTLREKKNNGLNSSHYVCLAALQHTLRPDQNILLRAKFSPVIM